MAQGRAGTLVDVADAGKGFLNLVKPQVTTSRADAGDNERADSLINQLLASSKDDHQALIDSILQRSAIDFAPTRAAEIGSGGYNSSTLMQLQNEARARATSDSVKAVTDAQAQDKSTAAGLEGKKLDANRTQTVQPPTSVGSLLKTVGASVALNKLFQTGMNKMGLGTGANATGVRQLPGSSSKVYDDSVTSEGAANYDNGTGIFAGNNAAAGEVGGSAGFGGGGEAAVSGSYGDFGGLTSEELNSVIDISGNTALGNSASFASLTDASVPNSLAASIPDAYGDFGSTLGAYSPEATATAGQASSLSGTGGSGAALGGGSGVVGGGAGAGANAGALTPGASSDIGAAAATSDVLSAESSASAINSGATVADGGATAAEVAGADVAASAGAAEGGIGAGVAGFAEAAIPAYIGATVATQVGGDLLETAFGGEDAGIIGDFGDFFGDVADTVICSELVRQGKMSQSTRRYNRAWAHKNINATAMHGYLEAWGPMYVRLMRRSSVATSIGEAVFTSWSKWIRKERSSSSWLGQAVVITVWIPSWLIGKYLQLRDRSAQAWI